MTATTTPPRAPSRWSETPEPQRPVRRVAFGHRLSRWDLKFSPYLYISPFFILFAIVGLFPIAYTAVISFMDWDLVRNAGEFVGFEQYSWILGNPKFWIALRNTFSIFLLSSIPQLIAAIFIAAMLDQNIRAKTFWRMGVLVPYVMAPVAVALIFRFGRTTRSGLGPIEPFDEVLGRHAFPFPVMDSVTLAVCLMARSTHAQVRRLRQPDIPVLRSPGS